MREDGVPMDHDGAHERAEEQHSQGHPGSPTEQTAHNEHTDHPSDDHAAHDKHRGHSPEMFRDRLLVSLLLTVPILYFAPQIQEWFGYEAISFPGSEWVTPVLATILYLYGGGPRVATPATRDDDVDRHRHHRVLHLQRRGHPWLVGG
jgi:Cu2+-exporting ATPase